MRAFDFRVAIGVDELLDLAGKLQGVTGDKLTRALIPAVNAVATRFDTKARRAMNNGIALSDAYVSSRMEVERAESTPRFVITAAGPGRAGRKGLTILGHYNPRTVTGNLARPGGVTIEATRGKPETLTRRTFMMRLKKGTVAGDQMGVFERTGADTRANGKVVKRAWKHLYGISPYSLFRAQIERGSSALADDLQREGLAAIAEAITP